MTVDDLDDLDAMDPFAPNEGDIHVVVLVPPEDHPSKRQCLADVEVRDLLREHSLPGMEFTDALQKPLGFKIPIPHPNHVSQWPNTFTQGQAEYASFVDALLEPPIVNDGATAVYPLDALWLSLFRDLCVCSIYEDEYSRRTNPTNNASIVKGRVLVGKCEPKASDDAMASAKEDLTKDMPIDAICTFPKGLASIPAWVTTSTVIEFAPSDVLPPTKTDRAMFVVDSFKILKWVYAVQEPNTWMHLVPQVRTKTPNSHYITWLKEGLVKELRGGDAEMMPTIERLVTKFPEDAVVVDMDIIDRIYQTLENAMLLPTLHEDLARYS
ncbi:hypothetical protein AaE_004757 [Aphanomyces astaci]|uniref:Uncharacterized protein n=1 Tax=Aphanomyces astaci TaxID=112090 RepID=A0A6A5AR02_APHAT|nr:hypothetical protein AaE_004757 [Aphanomyces astaci]